MNLEELFCLVDDFCKVFVPEWEKLLLTHGKRKRKRPGKLSISEMITIYLLFQSSNYRNFKHFYLGQILRGELKNAFPKSISYTRFVSLIPRIFMPLCAFLQCIRAEFDGIGFIDSTPIAVCGNKRIYGHKVFKQFAQLGKTTKGWFYGFKLHLICNSRGEFCACKITPGNCSDLTPVDAMTTDMLGKLFGDKGYIDEKLGHSLLQRGLHLITGIRKNMKNKLMLLIDKILLRKRSVIESTNNQLKNVFHLEHTRHRSPINGFISMICAIISYAFHPTKASFNLTAQEMQMLVSA